MGAAIVSLISSLPALISLFLEVIAWVKTMKSEDAKIFVKNVADVMSQVRLAKTSEEKVNAAKAIQSLVSQL